MGSRISVTQNQVVAAHYNFIIPNNNSTKWASMSRVNSFVSFFHRLSQEFVVSVLYNWLNIPKTKQKKTIIIVNYQLFFFFFFKWIISSDNTIFITKWQIFEEWI